MQVTSPLELTLLAEKDYFKLLVRAAADACDDCWLAPTRIHAQLAGQLLASRRHRHLTGGFTSLY